MMKMEQSGRGEKKKHRPEVDKPVTTKGPLRHVPNGVLSQLTNPVEKLKRVKTNMDEQSRSECTDGLCWDGRPTLARKREGSGMLAA